MCVCVCVCVRKSEREIVCMCEFVKERDWCVCVCEWERERMCVCVSERERLPLNVKTKKCLLSFNVRRRLINWIEMCGYTVASNTRTSSVAKGGCNGGICTPKPKLLSTPSCMAHTPSGMTHIPSALPCRDLFSIERAKKPSRQFEILNHILTKH